MGRTGHRSARRQGQGADPLAQRAHPAGGKWSDDRVIIFTEYRATQNWLQGVLAAEGLTGNDRLLTMYGGMDSKDRERIKAAFQTDPEAKPGPHPACHRRRHRGHRPPEPLLAADPLRDPVEPEPAGAAQRPHRPPRPEGEEGADPPLRRQGLQRPRAAHWPTRRSATWKPTSSS